MLARPLGKGGKPAYNRALGSEAAPGTGKGTPSPGHAEEGFQSKLDSRGGAGRSRERLAEAGGEPGKPWQPWGRGSLPGRGAGELP